MVITLQRGQSSVRLCRRSPGMEFPGLDPLTPQMAAIIRRSLG
jgi:hypothetical protein